MSERHLPVHPNLDQLKHQAKDLLRDMKREQPGAKLADAQFALARSYGVASWPRLVLACRIVDAIWRDDVEAVRELVETSSTRWRAARSRATGDRRCRTRPILAVTRSSRRCAN
jgi:hypothetical protein